MNLTFEVAGEKQVSRELLRFAGRTVDAQPAFIAIAELLMVETKEQFETEGRHASGGWKPLKQATVTAKARAGQRVQILQRTGSLMDSLTQAGDGNMIHKTYPDGLDFGSRVPYAGFHQTGTRHMPARKPLELTETARRSAIKLLQRWIVEGGL